MRVLIIEDSKDDADLFKAELARNGLKTAEVHRVEDASGLESALNDVWDIVICDYSLPQLDAFAALKTIGQRDEYLPCIIVSGSIGEERAVELMKAGASDYVLKGNLQRLVPAMFREIEEAKRRRQLREATDKLEAADAMIKRLKRFFPPQIAEQFMSGHIEDPFAWHNQDVTVLFIDLRGFTAFSEKTEPESLLMVLNDYYRTVANIAHKFGGSVGHLAGDGIMIFFNDPVRIERHQHQAVKMALQARASLLDLSQGWGSTEMAMHFGMGMATGVAAIGGIGSEGFWDFTVVGTVSNLASRLCSEARAGQILVSRRFYSYVRDSFAAADIGNVEFKGISVPIRVMNIVSEV